MSQSPPQDEARDTRETRRVERLADPRVSGSILRAWLQAAARALAANVDEINELNVFPVPDADTGTNSNVTFQAAVAAVAALPNDADAATVAKAMGMAAALGARGNSGVILSQMLQGVSAAAIDPDKPFTAAGLARVLESAATAGREAVGDPRDGTMLSVMADAAAAAGAAVPAGDLPAVAVAAADAARRSLEDTPNHLAVLAAAGVVDAGGRAIVVVLDALAEVLTGEPRPAWHAPVLTRSCEIGAVAAAYTGPAFEVMYVLRADAPQIADVRAQLVSLGDSLAVVGGDGVWNVHVHVDDPAAAVDIGRAAGQLDSLRVAYLRTGFSDSAERGAGTSMLAVVPASPLAEQLRSAGATVLEPIDEAVADAIAGAETDVIACLPRRLDIPTSTRRIAQVVCPTPVHMMAAASVWSAEEDLDLAAAQVAAAVSQVSTASVMSDGAGFVATAGMTLRHAPDLAAALACAAAMCRSPHHEMATIVVGLQDEASARASIADIEAESGLAVEVIVCPLNGARAIVGLE